MKRLAQGLLVALDRPDGTLSILLADDRQMARLNERWMGEAGPTDVLSFPMDQGKKRLAGPVILGDVAISVETAARRAGPRVFEEAGRYLIHGLLHLIGHDHVRLRDRRRMNQQARRLQRMVMDARVVQTGHPQGCGVSRILKARAGTVPRRGPVGGQPIAGIGPRGMSHSHFLW
ncbi:MAG: rRNA maturation RNase YbeY [Candidatus Omnitrophica bacterium]|nr:rRNA maturation RNase YbeY [Candidatus Omnitrophota bacterium]